MGTLPKMSMRIPRVQWRHVSNASGKTWMRFVFPHTRKVKRWEFEALIAIALVDPKISKNWKSSSILLLITKNGPQTTASNLLWQSAPGQHRSKISPKFRKYGSLWLCLVQHKIITINKNGFWFGSMPFNDSFSHSRHMPRSSSPNRINSQFYDYDNNDRSNELGKSYVFIFATESKLKCVLSTRGTYESLVYSKRIGIHKSISIESTTIWIDALNFV